MRGTPVVSGNISFIADIGGCSLETRHGWSKTATFSVLFMSVSSEALEIKIRLILLYSII